MRTSGCTMQEALTPESLNIVKQAMILARRRGHAQITPLHVAQTMLSSSTGLFRTACLQSHSHPILQCKALELCFNVALNRLPAANSVPMLSTHTQYQQYPSISNALIAAFKRAQANQRRGSIETLQQQQQQQQSLLVLKIESEQLIISILDDPSVSRVMREAGFSSTQVKTNVEKSISSNPTPKKIYIHEESVMSVIENLTTKQGERRSFVLVGQSVGDIEGIIGVLTGKIEKREVPEGLREVKFIKLSLSSFGELCKAEVEQRVLEIKSVVSESRGVVLYLGDLKWAVEYWERERGRGRGYYCPVEEIVMEIGKLVNGIRENWKFCVLGIADFQTYLRCKNGCPSLESVWDLHPLTVPAADSLSLSLITDSDPNSQTCKEKAQEGTKRHQSEYDEEKKKQLNCCGECSAKFEKEAQSLRINTSNSDSTTTSSLPAWLQQYKKERELGNNDQEMECQSISDLCKKWNSTCSSIHQQTLNFSSSSASPSSSASGSSSSHNHFCLSDDILTKPSLTIYIPNHTKDYTFQWNLNSAPTSSSTSTDIMETEHNTESYRVLCNELETKFPWQKSIIPEIVRTVLKCRSGAVKRKGYSKTGEIKQETWLIFQGDDLKAKEKIARDIARLVFGSETDNFISIPLSSFSPDASPMDNRRSKRSRSEGRCSYIERFGEEVRRNPHRVFLIEDVEEAGYFCQMGFKMAIERGRVRDLSGEEIGLCDAIVIFSSERLREDVGEGKEEAEKGDGLREGKRSGCLTLDLNVSIGGAAAEGGEGLWVDEIELFESVDRWVDFNAHEQ